MDERLRGVHQRVIIAIGKAEPIFGQLAAKDANTRIEMFVEFRKSKMELQGLPKPLPRFLIRLRTNQQVERIPVPGQQAGNEIAAQVPGRAGYEDRHNGSGGGAVEAAEARAACADQSSSRGVRDSNGRP